MELDTGVNHNCWKCFDKNNRTKKMYNSLNHEFGKETSLLRIMSSSFLYSWFKLCTFLITFVRLFLSKNFQQFMIYTCVKLHLEAIFKDTCIDRRLPSNFKTASSEYYLFSGDRNMYKWSKTEIGQERKIKNSTIKKWLNSSLSIMHDQKLKLDMKGK